MIARLLNPFVLVLTAIVAGSRAVEVPHHLTMFG